MLPHKIHRCADTGVVIEFGDRIDPLLSRVILDLAEKLNDCANPGILEAVPSFRSLMVQFDPFLITEEELLAFIEDIADARPNVKAARLWNVPICYDAQVALDLNDYAAKIGMTPGSVVEAHASSTYSVYMLGFLPGQPYLGDLPKALHAPRLPQPRLRVPAGSVGVAMSLTSIFPMETPCGWSLIGRTPIKLWSQDDPSPFMRPGDRVRFCPISLVEFDKIANLPNSNSALTSTDLVGAAA